MSATDQNNSQTQTPTQPKTSFPRSAQTTDKSQDYYPRFSLQGMFKACSDNNDKYSGSPSENFNRKLALFEERCEQNEITGEQRIKAFSIMLCGHALQFFLDSLKGKSLCIADTYNSVRLRFEPE